MDLSSVTLWYKDGETKIEEGDVVKVELNSGERITGEIYTLDGDYITIESDLLGVTDAIEMSNILDIQVID